MLRKFSLSITTVLVACCLYSQERLGIATSNYAGTNAMMLNPASMVNSPFRWDLNLVTVHGYFDNNFAYIQDANIPRLISQDKEIQINNNYNQTHLDLSDAFLVNLKNNNFRKNFYLTSMVQGPSLIYSEDDWSFGLHTAVRAGASMRGVSNESKQLFYEGFSYDPLQDGELHIPRFRVNTIVWNEIGMSLGKVLKEERTRKINGGITVKRLRGYGGAYFRVKNVDMEVATDTSFFFLDVNAGYGYAPREFEDEDMYRPVGTGFGFDVGIVIEDTKSRVEPIFNIQCPHWDCVNEKLYYNWRLGISLIDAGFIRFKDRGRKFEVENSTSSDEIYKEDLEDIEEFADLDSLIFSRVYDESLPREIGNTFSSMTPWALSVQFDYFLAGNFYLNSTVVQSLPHFGWAGIDRANILSFTPRYDHKRFGFSMPIVMYNYVHPRIGAALRINNFFIIGTDKIGSFIGNRLDGADIYFSLKINRLKKCGKSNRYNYINRVLESLKD